MTPENIENLIKFGGVLVPAFTTMFMVFYKGKELQSLYENNLGKKLKSSIDYDENFFRNITKKEYSKNVKDAAACDLVGSENVDAFLVNLLLEFHERGLVDLNEMIFLFKQGHRFGYLKYDKNNNVYKMFRFYFSKGNNEIYYSNVENAKKSKKRAKILFIFVFWFLIFYSLFFAYFVVTSTTFYDFVFLLILGIIIFSLAFLFPRLSFAMDHTELFLEKFYQAEREYKVLIADEVRKKLEVKSNSTVSNYSQYKRRS
ncbi:hypothetical protein [Acinetobacter vivianii]|uniref:hypothetical protein n=1 Tax=Acinetobacter vivianii TaxID=1776742 RepID=UPI004042CEF0